MPDRDVYESFSPLDYRYYAGPLARFLTEDAFVRYKIRVELALVQEFAGREMCPDSALEEVERACAVVTTAEVYARENGTDAWTNKATRHDIRALVHAIVDRVGPDAKPFVHMGATSYDIVDTANAARFRDAMMEVILPELHELLAVLIALADREASTLQIGRTHGQHAVPITFGFAIAGYVNRLGGCLEELQHHAARLVGKFSGAVGGFNATALFFEDPREFEAHLLARLGLTAAPHATQIVPPEPLMRLLGEIELAAGVMANLARDMRHLQRSEIGEVGEAFEASQVGSSTMPQKRNPINFENVESLWKKMLGAHVTVLIDQVSEHQRDLTGSASGRAGAPETLAYFYEMITRLRRTMAKLAVDTGSCDRNLAMSGGAILAEPLYLILASLGHPDAHEKVRALTLKAQREGASFHAVFMDDEEIKTAFWDRMRPAQQAILADPTGRAYAGLCAERARAIAAEWRKKLAP